MFSAYFLPYGKTTKENKEYKDIRRITSDIEKLL